MHKSFIPLLLLPAMALAQEGYVLPPTDNTWDIGSSLLRFRQLHVGELNIGAIGANGDLELTIAGDLDFAVQGDIISWADILPHDDNTFDLGSNSKRWAEIHGMAANFVTIEAVGVTADNFVGGGQDLEDIDADNIDEDLARVAGDTYTGTHDFTAATVRFSVAPQVTAVSVTATADGRHIRFTADSQVVTCPASPAVGDCFSVSARSNYTFEVEPHTGGAIAQIGATAALSANTHLEITGGWANVFWDGTNWVVQGN